MSEGALVLRMPAKGAPPAETVLAALHALGEEAGLGPDAFHVASARRATYVDVSFRVDFARLSAGLLAAAAIAAVLALLVEAPGASLGLGAGALHFALNWWRGR